MICEEEPPEVLALHPMSKLEVARPARRIVALPLLSRLCVHKKDLSGIDLKHRLEFRTKPELAVELLRYAEPWPDLLNLPTWPRPAGVCPANLDFGALSEKAKDSLT
ncbi:hypothetical protein [Singulisphaera sp. PoT]|uniref:hypothetical protein n=1 Tax=Singulisphaera sp. PoT TaxID=3411797 RepID=UPI003BF4B7D3